MALPLPTASNDITPQRLVIPTLLFGVVPLACYALAKYFYTVFDPPVYLTFHTTLEIMSVVVSFIVFLVAWYSYRQTGDGRDLIIGLTLLVVGVQDFAHTLSYSGMPAFFNSNSVNKASTYWIAARTVEAVGLIAALLTPRGRKFSVVARTVLLTGTLALAAGLLLVILLCLPVLPPMFIPGRGQTGMKIVLEYGVIAAKLFALFLLLHPKVLHRAFPKADRYLALALLVGIFSEMAFTLYTNAYDTYNLLGHIYKITAYGLILQALFVATLQNLYETNCRLRENDRLKNEFLANTNHELRTPLTSIIAFTELIEDESTGQLNEVQQDYLKEIKVSSAKLLCEINSLLELAKIEARRMEVHPEEFYVADLTLEIGRQLQPIFAQKGVRLLWNVDDGPPVYLDRGKLKQVISNLLSNALKFTPAGGEVTARVETETDRLTVKVRDTGIGIPQKEQEKIFARFYQVDGSPTRRYRGTGIGLAFCRELVSFLEGRIEVESNPGEGTQFTVTLPTGERPEGGQS